MRAKLILCCLIMGVMLFTGCGNDVTRGISTDPDEFPDDLQVLEIDGELPTPTIATMQNTEAEVSENNIVIQDEEITLILNTVTMKAHKPDCSSVKDIKSENIRNYTGTIEEVIREGYQACKRCQPY